jgi:HD superfamily phosphodiesterase
LKSIESFNFNIFKFDEEVGRGLTLPAISNYVFIMYDLFDTINLKNFETFVTRVRLGYNNNPYHNDVHAADVLQTCAKVCSAGRLMENLELSKVEMASVLVSALVHDIGHSGLNNTYQMNKCTKLALRYNDKSVLENFHCYEGFKILKNPSSNILEGLQKEEIRIFRKRMIELILATDMSNHTKVYTTLKLRIDSISNEIENSNNRVNQVIMSDDKIAKFDKQQDVLNFIIHTCDISNPAKEFEIYSKWTDLVTQEFFNQGDLEKSEGLPISFLCDRTTTNIPKSQISFISSIVFPLFKILCFIIPGIEYYEKNLDTNTEIWKGQLDSS